MAVKLLFFAQCADWMKRRELELELDGPVRVARLVEERPVLAPLRSRPESVLVALNLEFAGWEAEVKDGDEVAFMPPVSGG